MKYITNMERRGRTEGRTEGRAEGRTEGRVEALRDAALEFLEARFGEVPYELREEVRALANETCVKRLPRLAAVATDLADFRRRVRTV